MNVGVISRNVGTALIFNAAFMLLCAITAAIHGFDSSFSPLLLSAIITFVFGVFPLIFVHKQKDVSIKEGLAIILFAWVLCCIFGMIPYVLWGGPFTLSNAWFESVSGYTTTGATILTEVESLPAGLQLWRSSTHYIGGVGVVIFIMLVLPSWGSSKLRISKMEFQDVSKPNYRYKSRQLARIEMSVYGGLTVLTIVSLMIAGMPFFDAVNHAFSTVSTGGFSVKNASIAAYNSVPIEMVLTIFMIVSSLHFGLIYATVVGGSTKIFKDPVAKFYLWTILISTIVITLDLLFAGVYHNVWMALRRSVFQVASIISSTGFATDNTVTWPVSSMLLIMYLSIQCGCSGSTTGGVKSDRIWLVLKAMKAQIQKIIHPNAVVSVKTGGQVIEKELINSSAVFILTYLLILLICALVYSFLGLDFTDSISTSVTFIGNVGPAFGHFGSFDNYSTLPVIVKLVAGVEMLVGRLGVFPVLIAFSLFRRRN